MTFRRALPVLRPTVVSTPYPAGDRIIAKGSIAALSRAPPLADLIKRLCLGASFSAAARTCARFTFRSSSCRIAPVSVDRATRSPRSPGRYGTLVQFCLARLAATQAERAGIEPSNRSQPLHQLEGTSSLPASDRPASD